MEFEGPWKTAAAIDCYDKYPKPSERPSAQNLLRPKDSLNPRFPEGPRPYGNSFLFYADMTEEQLDDVLTVGSKTVRPDTIYSAGGSPLCRELGGYGSPEDCAVVVIRNTAHLPNYGGGADPHFLPLYSFLPMKDRPAFADAWLPYGVSESSCKKGGGCCGYRGCIPTLVSK